MNVASANLVECIRALTCHVPVLVVYWNRKISDCKDPPHPGHTTEGVALPQCNDFTDSSRTVLIWKFHPELQKKSCLNPKHNDDDVYVWKLLEPINLKILRYSVIWSGIGKWMTDSDSHSPFLSLLCVWEFERERILPNVLHFEHLYVELISLAEELKSWNTPLCINNFMYF